MTIWLHVMTDRRDWYWRPTAVRSLYSRRWAWLCFEVGAAW